MENASAMQVTLGTTVTAQQTSALARARMARSAAAGGTVSVGSASAQSREPLGRRVRSAQPAQMLAAPRGNGAHPQPPLAGPSPRHRPVFQPVSSPGRPASPRLCPPGLAGERNSY